MKLLAVFLLFVNCSSAQLGFQKQWDKKFGGINFDGSKCIIKTVGDGYLLGGDSYSGISGDKTQPNWDSTLQTDDFWIVKTDFNGIKLWDKRYGSTGADGIFSIYQTADDGYIIGGICGVAADGDKTQPGWGGYDFWVVKIDSNGTKQWDKRFGGSLTDLLIDIKQTKDGGYIMCGLSNSNAGGDKTQDRWGSSSLYDDGWVVKVDSVGTKQWDKRFGGTNEDNFSSVLQTDDGGYLLAGYSVSDSGTGDVSQSTAHGIFWLVKIDSLGNKLWDKRHGGGADELRSMIKTKDGNYLLAGTSSSGVSGDKSQPTQGMGDYWLIKVDTAGNKIWDKDFGGIAEEMLYSIFQTNDGGFLLGGVSQSWASGDKTENNLGTTQSWLIKTDSLGNKQWDKTIFTITDNLVGYSIQSNDDCYVVFAQTASNTGGYKTQDNWDVTLATPDYWLVKFCDSTITDVPPLSQGTGLGVRIFPNPFATDLNILVKKEGLKEATFTITNMLGQVVYKKGENNLGSTYTKMLALSYLPNGIYIVEVVVGGEKIVRRIVKE